MSQNLIEFTYFNSKQLLPLLVSSIVLIISIFSFHLNKSKTALFLLFIGSLGLGYFIANLDNFLNIWDEQYHALVAKNMIANPFKPMLYTTPLLDYDFRNWTTNHIWLHKQPLFLWQIALSLKLFGIHELAVRIPSILLHAFVSLMVYRIGKISYNASVGFYGALFFSVNYHILELIAGKYPTDHNDISFLFYVTASIWAWFEYQNSQNKYWILLIGLFSGCAVLVKWLVGLLVYAIWGISIGVNTRNNLFKLKSYYPILVALSITLLIFVPWQLFILHQFPAEASYEYQLNTEHFFKVVENHGGDIWFHFNALKDIYGSGDAIPFILLLGLVLFLKNSAKIYRVAGLSAIIIVYSFYTLAATKMTSFCIIVSPFFFLALGAIIYSVIELLKSKIQFKLFKTIFPSTALIVICFFLLDISKIENYHTDWKPEDNRNRNKDLEQMALIQSVQEYGLDETFVVFNSATRLNGHIPVMFYTNCIAYDFIPNSKQIEIIKNQSYKIAIVDDGDLPHSIKQDNAILKIKYPSHYSENYLLKK